MSEYTFIAGIVRAYITAILVRAKLIRPGLSNNILHSHPSQESGNEYQIVLRYKPDQEGIDSLAQVTYS